MPGRSGLQCQIDACVVRACPSIATCTFVVALDRAICNCPPGFQGDSCEQSQVLPGIRISGQSGWASGTYNASGPATSTIVEQVQIPAPQFVFSGIASWWVSNENATGPGPGLFVSTPAFNKTDGEPSIVEFLTGNQFRGGDSFSDTLYFKAVSPTGDGTRLGISIGSNINLNSSATVLVENRVDTGLTVTVLSANGTNQYTKPNLDRSIFHQLYMKLRTFPGPDNDELWVYVDGNVMYDGGPTLERRYAKAMPMNCLRFEFGYPASAIGSLNTSPKGFYIDLLSEEVFNATAGDDFFGTSFEPPLCSNFSSPCVQNNGTCYASNNITYCTTCPAGRVGSVCQTDVDECASSPCLNGGTCRDLLNQFSCTCDNTGFLGTCVIRALYHLLSLLSCNFIYHLISIHPVHPKDYYPIR